ncbi:Sensory/regulatory protein RpfC [Flavobacterium sp. 9R]|uniref:tetratricopeptide repeat-containing hybrid sensor histidine kinase/response regulator n=1 Tax=Flavobacterium sp. 9R TaxID=2653143 RepID=UPI0012F2E245|nr:ATP-binding protein [Flavobacterium sp. 9R]VXC17894.1 Sensory/regulatory protein RpfC [Flavobacterium sp. 9R]
MKQQIKYFWILLLVSSTMLSASSTQIIDSISIYHNLSQYNFKIHNYEKALHFANKSLKYSQTTKNIEAQIERNFVLGKLYFDLKKYNEAQNYFEQSCQLNTKNPADFNKFKAIYFEGYCAIEKKDWNKASLSFAKADNLPITPALKKKVNLLLLRKAKLYFSNNQYDIASVNFDRVLSNSDPATEKNNIEAVYLYTGIITLQNKQYPEALALLEKALALNKTTKNLKSKENILLQLSKCYKGMRNFDQAYSYLEEYHLLKMHLAEIINAKQNQENFKQFKRDEAYKAIIKKNKEQQQAEDANKYSKLINILAIALITILSLLSLSLYKNNIIRNESNKLLKEKNQELIIAKNNAEKASKARAEFLSTVSHELRTPLNAINGITHLLLEEKPKKSQLNYLASLQFSGNYLATFINEILEINKIESNKIELENISFHLKELLENIQSSLNKFALTNNNAFNLEFDNNIPNYLIGDPTKLSQVFLNLINNALKFTHDGTVTIVANLIKIKDDKAKINFQIIDTGIGIPQDKLELVFENFSQGSVEINRKYGGTGLGLTIVKKLVKVLGGKIKLVSEEGKGSTFSFSLPFTIAKSLEEATEKVVNYDEEQFRSKKILLVEDNKINQMITKKMLENKGIVCIIIDNGEDAVKLMHNHEYDLVLMDVHLPGINGTEATKQIREFDNTVPIIALTAISLDENRETLLSYGMNDVITKPFIPEEFYTIISKYIAN